MNFPITKNNERKRNLIIRKGKLDYLRKMDLTTYLAIGTIAMLFVMILVRRHYVISDWKTVIASVLLTITGLLGATIMARIESGHWGGVSLYGAIFLAPIVMSFIALILRIKPLELLDMCAPAECVMLALLKIKCFIDGCCHGRLLCVLDDGTAIRFPSQIVEAGCNFMLMLILIVLIYKKKSPGKIYFYYMIIYGVLRFILNWFRDVKPFMLGLPAGNFWSLVSIIIGVLMVVILCRQEKKKAIAVK